MDQTVDTAPSSDAETVQISLPWTWRPVKRRMLPGCDFFRDGDRVMQISRKLIPVEDGGEEEESRRSSEDRRETIPCGAVGCRQTFTSLLSYENHYQSAHGHRCLSCRRCLPSAFLLDLHIEENHDPLFALHSNTQYRCLVEGCDLRFPSPEDRRHHVIRAHHYPANFRFHRLTTHTHHLRPKHKEKASKKGDHHTTIASVAAATATAGVEEADNEMDVVETASRSPLEVDEKRPNASNTPPPLPQTVPPTARSTRSHTHSDSPTSSHSDKENAALENPEKEEEGRGGGGVVVKGEVGMEVQEEEGKEKEVVPPPPRRVFVPKVPQNFSFGHGVGRGFQRPPGGKKRGRKKGGHWHQTAGNGGAEGERTATSNIENVDMKDMADALSEAS